MSLLLSLSATAALVPMLLTVQLPNSQTVQRAPAANVNLIAQITTVLAFQTESYSIRIFTRDGQLVMNVFDRQNNYLWLRDVVVNATATPEGYTYRPVGSEEPPVEVFQSQYDESSAAFTFDGTTELATVVTDATVPTLEGNPPASTPSEPTPLPTAKVAACWAFPNTAYIYRQNGRTLMDVSDREDDVTWLRGVPVTATPSSEGVNYYYAGETAVEVYTSAFDGSCAIVIDDNTPEFGSQ